MAWTKPQYTKGEINRAGRSLLQMPADDPGREDVLHVVDNWRMCHAYPLQIVKMTLLRRAKRISRRALIAQRLKRRPSIELKLLQNPHMQLSQMQDVGGCRAVMPSISGVKKLLGIYKRRHAKSPKKTRSVWDGSEDFDYVARPKTDGYRSVHLIFRFQSASPERRCYNGQRVEIQIRSRLQHLWATAVETAQIFTGQALKSKIKDANEDWLRFFALVSGVFAIRERCPAVPGVATNRDEIIKELKTVSDRQNIMAILWGWSNALKSWEQAYTRNAEYFLLELNPAEHMLRTTPFESDELPQAQQAYELREKMTEKEPEVQVVLVSVDSVQALRKAYPNYYADTGDFIGEVVKEAGLEILPKSEMERGKGEEFRPQHIREI